MGRLKDIRSLLPRPSIFFDVGANVGQSIAGFRTLFPNVRIYSFEPVPDTYEALVAAASGDPLVQAYGVALGEREGTARMAANGTSTGNRIVSEGEPASLTVNVTTGDAFCGAQGIEGIDYLKIDAEGHDLAVLRGFRGMIADCRIQLIEVEAGLNPDNAAHVDLNEFRAALEPAGYRLIGVYSLVREKGRPQIRRCNALFGLHDLEFVTHEIRKEARKRVRDEERKRTRDEARKAARKEMRDEARKRARDEAKKAARKQARARARYEARKAARKAARKRPP